MLVDKDRDLVVRKNNTLVKAKYSLTTNESKVFLLLLYKLQVIESGVLKCHIKRSEFREIFKSSRDCTVKSISSMLSELRKKPIYFMTGSKEQGHSWGEYGFINGYEYKELDDVFEIESSQKIYDVVKNYLEGGYTPNNLLVLFGVRNPYTFRIYDLMRLWSGQKTVIYYTIQELRELLMLEDKYPDYYDFKKRAINPPIKELKKTGVLNIEFKERKIKKKVIGLEFFVTDLDKRKGFNDTEVLKKEGSTVELQDEAQRVPNDNYIYIPSELDIEDGLKKMFSTMFKEYDFNDPEYLEALLEAENITKEKDNMEKIVPLNYKLFVSVLKNKLKDVDSVKMKRLEEEEESKYWQMLTEEERFDAYTLRMTCKEYYNINNLTEK